MVVARKDLVAALHTSVCPTLKLLSRALQGDFVVSATQKNVFLPRSVDDIHGTYPVITQDLLLTLFNVQRPCWDHGSLATGR